MSELLTNFAARSGVEGPQILVTWGIPTTAVDEILILKKAWNFSDDETDGTAILQDFTGLVDHVVDIDILPNQVYAYTGFTRVGSTWYTEFRMRASAFSWDSENAQRLLFKTLPDLYKLMDGKGETLALTKVQDVDNQDVWRALHEDGSVDRGQLERFMMIFGAAYSRIKGGADFIQHLLNPDEAPPEYLGRIAEYIGWPLDSTKPTARQRAELRQAVPTYKRKGTISALEPMLRAATGIANVVVDEMTTHMLISNRIDRLSAETVPARLPNTLYALGDIVRPTDANVNGRVYRATVGGTSAGGDPTAGWLTTFGDTEIDGGVTWQVVIDASIFDWYEDQTGFSIDFPEFDDDGNLVSEAELYTFEMLRLWFILAPGEDLTSQEIARIASIMPLFAPGDTRYVIRTEQ